MQISWCISTPVIHFGEESSLKLQAVLIEHAHTKPLIVADPFLISLPVFQQLTAGLEEAGISYEIMTEFSPNPSLDDVQKIIARFQTSHCDSLVAIGGGSAIDAAKGAALSGNNSHDFWQFCFFETDGDVPVCRAEEFIPYYVIPTTAGTGSELSGSSAVISDPMTHRKRVVYHPDLNATAVFDDPLFLVTLPANLTAWTGMDALTHAIEAYCSPMFDPISDGIAMESVRMIANWLRPAVMNGKNIEARFQMLAASSAAAIAFSSKGLGATHSLAHSIGAIYGSQHGLTNAVLLPFILQHNRSAIEAKVTTLARLIDLQTPTFDGFIEWLHQLRSDVGIPDYLKDIGVRDSDAALIVEKALQDAEHKTNPVEMNADGFYKVLAQALPIE